MSAIEQGGVFIYDFGPHSDSRQEGVRPVLVVQTDMLNRLEAYSLTIVVPFTTKGKNTVAHVAVEPSRGNGLDARSFAKCEQLYTIPKMALRESIGKIAREDLYRVKEALSMILAL